MEAISTAQLKGFDAYKYSSADTSPLSQWVMHPFWNFVTRFIPNWIAPNVLTFSGFLCLVVNYCITFYYDPYYQDAVAGQTHAAHLVPASIWLLCSFLHFMSHTLDGCDGKQARKIGNTGPLGELMDHGLDSMAAWLQTVSACTCVGVASHSWVFFTITCGIMLSFYLTHWEKYNTGLLFLPWTYDASQVLVSSVYLLSGLYGTEFYTTPVLSLAWIHPSLDAIRILDVFIVGSYVSILSQPVISVYNIATCNKRLYGFWDGLSPLFPLAAMFTCFSIWLHVSPTNVIQSNGRLFLTSVGLAFSNLTCQLIVAQMSGQKHASNNLIIFPLPLILTLVYHFHFQDTHLLYLYVLYATALHTYYGVTLVSSICNHLNIYCFRVNPAKFPAGSASAPAPDANGKKGKKH